MVAKLKDELWTFCFEAPDKTLSQNNNLPGQPSPDDLIQEENKADDTALHGIISKQK